MNYKNSILIVSGEPNSVFLELFFKAHKKTIKNPIILISSEKLLKLQMNKLNFKKKIKLLNVKRLSQYKLDNNFINLINIELDQKKAFEKISKKSNEFIKNSFEIAFKIIKKDKIYKLINGPVSKKSFLEKKYLGITEYISQKFNLKKTGMLIYNRNLSACPATTHLPLKGVSKKITKKLITEKIIIINNFYKNILKKKPKVAVLGLNPHCESIYKFNEDSRIIKPAVNNLKKLKYNVSGPFPADTFFLSQNRKKYDVVLGMYHDQVLTPLKTLFEYDAINITMGLPFIRVSPDHGPNQEMLGKNMSNPTSLIRAINFLDKN